MGKLQWFSDWVADAETLFFLHVMSAIRAGSAKQVAKDFSHLPQLTTYTVFVPYPTVIVSTCNPLI